MRVVLSRSHRATYADYLATEQGSERRYELIDGVVVAMAGGSDEHNVIAARFAMLCGMRLSRDCRGYSSAQRFWIAATARARYSDGSIICGKPEHPSHDGQATINPVVVVEVLGSWPEQPDVYRSGESFELPTLLRSLAVDEIYDDILDADGRSLLR